MTFMISFLAIILIILIFYFLLRIKANSVKHTFGAAEEINELDLNPMLLNYLRSTVALDGKDYTVSDLIVMYRLGYLEAKELKKINIEYINKLNGLSEDTVFYLFIYDEKNKLDKSVSVTDFRSASVSEEVLIPVPGGKSVRVELIIPEERTRESVVI